MKVSVIMPAYNAEKYIDEAIGSILNQTFQDFELIIIDDCSTDNTFHLIKSIKSGKIVLLQTPQNSGAATSRNLGIASAKGEYIAFLDADDWAYPQRIEKEVDFLETNLHIDLVASWIEVVNKEGQKLPYVQTEILPQHLPAKLIFHNCFALSSVMIRRQLALYQFDNSYAPAEDYELWSRLAPSYQMCVLPTVLVRYLAHEDGISKRKQNEMVKMVHKIICNMLIRLEISPSEEEYTLHQQIGHLAIVPSVSFLINTHHWLTKLKNANERITIYSKNDFDQVLMHYWKYICQTHFHLRGKYLFSFSFWRTFLIAYYSKIWLKEKISNFFKN